MLVVAAGVDKSVAAVADDIEIEIETETVAT